MGLITSNCTLDESYKDNFISGGGVSWSGGPFIGGAAGLALAAGGFDSGQAVLQGDLELAPGTDEVVNAGLCTGGRSAWRVAPVEICPVSTGGPATDRPGGQTTSCTQETISPALESRQSSSGGL